MTRALATADIFTLPVFPAADVFPMMADDELAELAADIKANGLREPLVVAEAADTDGVLSEMLIDGRNRRAACKIAKVEPTTKHLNGEDPTAFVLSANIHRRHMTKGQLAMAVAMIYPEPAKLKRAGSSVTEKQISAERLSVARSVLRSTPELAAEVLAGNISLDAAYQSVRQQTGVIRNQRAQLAKLRDERPDLAELVTTEVLSLEDALAKASTEAEQRKQQRWAATMNIIDSIRPLDRAPETAEDEIQLFDPAFAESRGETVTPARLRRASEYLNNLADALEKLE